MRAGFGVGSAKTFNVIVIVVAKIAKILSFSRVGDVARRHPRVAPRLFPYLAGAVGVCPL